MTITVDESGKGTIKLSSSGFSKEIDSVRNVFTINWMTNEFEFHDLKDHVFTLDVQGNTFVSQPVDTQTLPPRNFGSPATQKVLNDDAIEEIAGNMPKLFCILPEGQGGFQILKDSDVQKHFISHSESSREDLKLSPTDNSISLSTVTPYMGDANGIQVYRIV